MHDGDDDDAGLGEEELEILRDAGIIAGPSKARKQRRSSRPPTKHIVFVENEEEGMYRRSISSRFRSWHAAQQYSTKSNDLSTSHPTGKDIADAIDLGWREPEKVKKGKKKDNAIYATDSTDATERSEAAKVRLPSALFQYLFIQRGHRPIEYAC